MKLIGKLINALHNLNQALHKVHLFGRANGGVFLALCLCVSFPVVGQESVTLAEASEETFMQAKQKAVKLHMNPTIRKVNHAIRIKPKQGSMLVFTDDLSEEAFKTYAYAGDLVSEEIILIHAQDYHTDRYIAVNLISGEQQVLIGFPHLLGDKIACLQGAETDVIPAIEFWQIRKNKLVLVRRVCLPEQRYPVDLVWKDAIKDTAGQCWKVVIG